MRILGTDLVTKRGAKPATRRNGTRKSKPNGTGAYLLYGTAATGTFSLAARLTLPDSAYVMGFDDVDGNRLPNSGDGQGFWDVNGDQAMTPADRIRIAPGDTITGAAVHLVTVP